MSKSMRLLKRKNCWFNIRRKRKPILEQMLASTLVLLRVPTLPSTLASTQVPSQVPTKQLISLKWKLHHKPLKVISQKRKTRVQMPPPTVF